MKVIETPRLLIRTINQLDFHDLLDIFTDPEVMRFYPRTYTHQEVSNWIAKWSQYFKDHQQGFLACETKETNEFIGVAGVLSPVDFDGGTETEIGYLFKKKYWGNGYATEAAEACLDYGFNSLEHHYLAFFIDPKNSASIRVAEKNGLKKERDNVAYRDRHACLFSMTKEAFNERFLVGSSSI